MESIHSVETFVYGTNKNLTSEKEEIQLTNITKQYQTG